jgi:hypothetical protein
VLLHTLNGAHIRAGTGKRRAATSVAREVVVTRILPARWSGAVVRADADFHDSADGLVGVLFKFGGVGGLVDACSAPRDHGAVEQINLYPTGGRRIKDTLILVGLRRYQEREECNCCKHSGDEELARGSQFFHGEDLSELEVVQCIDITPKGLLDDIHLIGCGRSTRLSR